MVSYFGGSMLSTTGGSPPVATVPQSGPEWSPQQLSG